MATKVFGAVAGNWNTDALWVGGVKPTAADDVTLTVASANVTIDAASVCRSLDCTTYTGTLMHNAFTLTIGDATAGASNIALKLVAGMTYTLTDVINSAISFISTSVTQQTIIFAGKNAGNITVNSASNGNYAFLDAITTDATATFTSTAGSIHLDGATDNSGLTHSIGKFVSTSSTARTIALGTATLGMIGSGTFWNMGTSNNITLTAANSTINQSGVAAGTVCTFTSGNKTYGTVNFSSAGETAVGTGAGATTTFTNYSRTGTPTSVGNSHLSAGLPANGTLKVTGIFTVTGTSNILRAQVWPNSNGVPAGLDLTGATVVLQYVGFQDVAFVSSTNLDFSGITGGSGDAGGNTISGGGTLTFSSPTTQTWQTTGAGNFSDVTKWTSRIPLAQDNVIFNSAFTGSPLISIDMPWTGNIDFSSSTGTVTLRSEMLQGANVIGNFTGRSGLTVSNSASCSMYWNSRASNNAFISNGTTISAISSISSSNGGNMTFADNVTIGAAVSHRSGIVTIPSGKTLKVNSYVGQANTAVAPSLVTGSGTLELASTGTVYSITGTVGLNTVTVSRITITNVSASTKTFAGSGNSYPDVVIAGGGAGAVIITGANTFNSITIVGGTKSITLPGSTTTTIVNESGFGNGANLITFTASAGSATISKSSGVFRGTSLSLTNIVATGGATFYAGATPPSVDGTGNTGWIFTAAPSNQGTNKIAGDAVATLPLAGSFI